MNINWTKEEFETYVLLFAAHCNQIETKEEVNYILSRVGENVYNKVHTEIVISSERENEQRIIDYLRVNSYSKDQKRALLNEVKEVFFADGTVDQSEKKAFNFLKELLN